jgi:hypothetical protein
MGAMLYAKAQNIARVGTFNDPSGIQGTFPAVDATTREFAGVIHQQNHPQ